MLLQKCYTKGTEWLPFYWLTGFDEWIAKDYYSSGRPTEAKKEGVAVMEFSV
jgi:hypothetical protein